MQCLYQLNVDELNKLVEKDLNLTYWFIRDDKITNRTDAIYLSDRYGKIKQQADSNGISYNDIEVVTWFDTLVTLYYVFDRVEDEDIRNNLKILQEYCIPYSRKRADYLLIYDNKILILEFSFNKLNYEFNYETKLQQAIGYKELLSNILPKEIEIGTYTFLLEPEEDARGKTIYFEVDGEKHTANHWKMYDLAKYIEKFFKKNMKVAYNAILQLEDC